MATAVMGQTQSVQANAIRELYVREGATGQRRRVLKGGVIRVAFFQRHRKGNEPASVWHVFRNGVARRVDA